MSPPSFHISKSSRYHGWSRGWSIAVQWSPNARFFRCIPDCFPFECKDDASMIAFMTTSKFIWFFPSAIQSGFLWRFLENLDHKNPIQKSLSFQKSTLVHLMRLWWTWKVMYEDFLKGSRRKVQYKVYANGRIQRCCRFGLIWSGKPATIKRTVDHLQKSQEGTKTPLVKVSITQKFCKFLNLFQTFYITSPFDSILVTTIHHQRLSPPSLLPTQDPRFSLLGNDIDVMKLDSDVLLNVCVNFF